jgi:hypothetical protein
MADTSLGRASLSVTADLSGFTSSLDTASTKVQAFGSSSVAAAMDANKVTTATEKVTLSLEQLQQAAVTGAANQMSLKSKTDLASKALELQARQMNIDSGATKKLHDEMVRLEQIEQKLIAAENKARGIPPPLPIKPPPIPENKNTAAFVLNAKKMSAETDILNKKLDQQARQMMIDSGAAAKLAQELSALEKAEKKLADAEQKINAAAGRGQTAKEKVKSPTKVAASSGGMKITDMMGIGFFTAVFDRMFTSVGNVIGAVAKLGTDIIDAGAKFQQVDIRLGALTGVSGMAQGLQDIMKSGPSASFDTLAEHATRLAALKFDANSVQVLTGQFNKLGIALGNPEKIMALIVDKIGDMASEGFATTAALDKLAEEGVNAYSVLAMRMQISEAEAKAAVAAGTVSVAEASSAISMLANDPKHIEGFAKTANSFYGIWQTASNNILALFQKIGGYFVEGFSLVKLSDTITQTFKSIGNKLDELKPYFLKFGVFVSSVFKIIGNSVEDFFKGWTGKAEEFNVEDIMKSAKMAAIDFGSSLLETVKLVIIGLTEIINSFNELIDTIKNFKPRVVDAVIKFKPLGKDTPGLDLLEKNNPVIHQPFPPFVPIKTDKTEKFFNDQINKLDILKREAAKPLEFGPPKNLMDPNQMEKPKSELRELIDFYKANVNAIQNNVGAKEWSEKVGRLRNFNQEITKIFDDNRDKKSSDKFPLLDNVLEKLEPKVKNLNDAFKDLNDEINRKEPPKWEKFLADNLTPLQIYQNELKKLSALLDPTQGPNGLKAFAIGSAAAIKKLKDATGLGGPQQFASAVQAGSAAEFQVKVDEMGKGKNVQEEIRQLMEAAAEVEAQQLEAAREIAEAIKNLPAAMPRPQQIAVALNP